VADDMTDRLYGEYARAMNEPEPRGEQTDCQKRGEAMKNDATCADCGIPYGDDGFQDLVVDDATWARISPTGDEGGLLCPSCMCRAACAAGISNARTTFCTGPFWVQDDEMDDAVWFWTPTIGCWLPAWAARSSGWKNKDDFRPRDLLKKGGDKPTAESEAER